MDAPFKGKVAESMDAPNGSGKTVGDKVAEGTEHGSNATGGVDKGIASIHDHMDVIACCGKKVGVVDHLEGEAIKLTKNDSPDGKHHFIPTTWIDHVDSEVHLSKNSLEAVREWKSDAASCGCANTA